MPRVPLPLPMSAQVRKDWRGVALSYQGQRNAQPPAFALYIINLPTDAPDARYLYSYDEVQARDM